MKDNLMQKMCDVFESIIKSEGATALIDEKIRKCCEENGVDYEEFSVSVLEEILSIIGAHSDDVGDMLPSELSSKDLDAVSGGTGFFRRGTASALAAISLCGATQLPASAGKQTNHHDASKRVTSRHVPDRREPYTINKSQPATNFVTNLATFALGSFLTYFFMHNRSGGPETTSPKLTDLAKNLLPVNGDGISKNPLLQGNGFLPENASSPAQASFETKFGGTITPQNSPRPFRIRGFNDTLQYCNEQLGFPIDSGTVTQDPDTDTKTYNEVWWGLPAGHLAPTVIHQTVSSVNVTAPLNPQRCATIWISNGRSLQTMNALKHKLGNSFDTTKTALLDFANFFDPGGAPFAGCVAQEESICRITTLYPLLRNLELYKAFYNLHKQRSSDYEKTHGKTQDSDYWNYIGTFKDCIYVPDVQQIKNDYGASRIGGFVNGPVFNIIAAAAPDLSDTKGEYKSSNTYKNDFRKLWRQIIVTAHRKGNTNLFAGPIGCGAFRNDPQVAAETFFEVFLKEGPNSSACWAECFQNLVLPNYIYNVHDAFNYAWFFDTAISEEYKGLNIQLLNLYCPE